MIPDRISGFLIFASPKTKETVRSYQKVEAASLAQPLLKKADGRLFCSAEFAVFDCKAVENCGI